MELRTRRRCHHGAVGIVVPVTEGGATAVIKISFPHPGNVGEWSALAAFGGRGAVRLYEVEPDLFAMLLERAHSLNLSLVEQTDEAPSIAGRIARRLAVPAPPATPRLSDLVARFAVDLVDQHSGETPERRLPDQGPEGTDGHAVLRRCHRRTPPTSRPRQHAWATRVAEPPRRGVQRGGRSRPPPGTALHPSTLRELLLLGAAARLRAQDHRGHEDGCTRRHPLPPSRLLSSPSTRSRARPPSG